MTTTTMMRLHLVGRSVGWLVRPRETKSAFPPSFLPRCSQISHDGNSLVARTSVVFLPSCVRALRARACLDGRRRWQWRWHTHAMKSEAAAAAATVAAAPAVATSSEDFLGHGGGRNNFTRPSQPEQNIFFVETSVKLFYPSSSRRGKSSDQQPMISQEMAVTLSYSEKLRDESRRQAAGGAGGASERGTACQKTSRAYFSTFRHVPDAFCSALLSAGPAVNDVARF